VILVEFGFDGGHNSPATVGGVLEVLHEGVITGFPTVKAILAEEADGIVRVIWGRRKVKASFGELCLRVSMRRFERAGIPYAF
jgi:hypothetical protein